MYERVDMKAINQMVQDRENLERDSVELDDGVQRKNPYAEPYKGPEKRRVNLKS